MSGNEAYCLIEKIRSSDFILVVVGAGLSRPSNIPTFRDDAWFWERPMETSATETAFRQDPLYVWAVYERLRVIASKASPNRGHAALTRLAKAKPNLLTVCQNIDDLCQRAAHDDKQLVSLHGSLFKVCCTNKECTFEDWNRTQEPTVPGLRMSPSSKVDLTLTSLHLRETDIPSCPLCKAAKLRPGVHWFGEKLPIDELRRVDDWFLAAPKVDLVLVIGTERSPFVMDALAKGAEVAWLNFFEEDLEDTGGDWYVNGCVSETLPSLVDAALP